MRLSPVKSKGKMFNVTLTSNTQLFGLVDAFNFI